MPGQSEPDSEWERTRDEPGVQRATCLKLLVLAVDPRRCSQDDQKATEKGPSLYDSLTFEPIRALIITLPKVFSCKCASSRAACSLFQVGLSQVS